MIIAAILYCWFPSSYGPTVQPPTCGLTYEQCRSLEYAHGGACRYQTGVLDVPTRPLLPGLSAKLIRFSINLNPL